MRNCFLSADDSGTDDEMQVAISQPSKKKSSKPHTSLQFDSTVPPGVVSHKMAALSVNPKGVTEKRDAS